jgi:hypothetical protein
VNPPAYVTPQGGTSQQYYFTARDAFRTESNFRTDVAANYTYGLAMGARRVDLFVRAHVINLFNVAQLCGCGSDVFQNGGGVWLSRINQTVVTAVNAPATYQRFNPFTETPVEGVHWAKGTNFGQPTNRMAYTSPRAFSMAFGVRF